MNKIKKIIALVLCISLFAGIGVIFAGCAAKEKKYDVQLMIVCKEAVSNAPILKKWIVDAQTSAFDIEQSYDGKQYDYKVYAYNVPDHPQFKEIWFFNDTNNAVAFIRGQYYTINDSDRSLYVCDKGNYSLNIYAREDSQLWNARQLTLRIKVV